MESSTGEVLDKGRLARLERVIKWWDGFCLSMAVPALLLYLVGDMATRLGVVSIVVWVISIFCAIWIVFGYCELTGIFHEKAGGA